MYLAYDVMKKIYGYVVGIKSGFISTSFLSNFLVKGTPSFLDGIEMLGDAGLVEVERFGAARRL